MDVRERREPPNWDEAKPFFQRDGALRDIYCAGSAEAWRSWLQALTGKAWSLEFRVGAGVVAPFWEYPYPIPEDAEVPGLSVSFVTGPRINSFFFDRDEIDADLQPQEFVLEAQWRELVTFLALMGDTCRDEVRLSSEGDHGHPWLVYRPQQREWVTVGRPEQHTVGY